MKQNNQFRHIIFPLAFACLMLVSCDTGGEDDGTLGNWFLAILWILVWLKGK